MGTPRIPKPPEAERFFRLRLTEAERRMLAEVAAVSDRNDSDFLRRVIREAHERMRGPA